MAAAGWYGDPVGRHEFRYWDGGVWTARVADAGVTGDDDAAPAEELAPPGPVPVAVARCYRAVAVRRWRAVVVFLGGLATGLALLFEIFASAVAAGSTASRSEEMLWLTSWLYQTPHLSTTGDTTVMELHYGYPPLVLWVALVVAFVLLARVSKQGRWVLKKVGVRATFRWSAPEERQRLGAGLQELGCSKGFLFSVRQRGMLAGGGVASLVVVLVSAYSLIQREGTMLADGATGKVVSDLSVGLGPVVCLVAGLVGVVAAIAAWPWTRQHRVLIRADGSVEAQPEKD
jgi:hypothetical protein